MKLTKTIYLMEGDITQTIRRSSLEDGDQIANPIQVNPITNPLQILKHRLENQNLKPHNSGGEARHADIASNIDENAPLPSPFGVEAVENPLDRLGDVGLPKGLAFEHPDDVLVRLLREIPQIGERVEERVFEAFDDIGDHGVGLWAFEAVEGLDCAEWRFGGFDCNGGGG